MSRVEWNPRFLCYCYAQGEADPVAQTAKDQERWPGGCMTGFILFVGEEKRAFFAAHPEAFLDRHTIYDVVAWDAWLSSRYPAPVPA